MTLPVPVWYVRQVRQCLGCDYRDDGTGAQADNARARGKAHAKRTRHEVRADSDYDNLVEIAQQAHLDEMTAPKAF